MFHALPLLKAVPKTGELLASQYWNAGRIRRYQRTRLRQILTVASRIPFYRDRLGRIDGTEDIGTWPVLKRLDIPPLNQSVRALHSPDTQFWADRSSGSTGMPVEMLFDTAHQAHRFASRMRYLWENGWRPNARTGWIVPIPEQTPDGKLMRSNALAGSRFLSIFTDYEDQVQWLERLDPQFIYTLPSNLEALLGVIEHTRTELPSLQRILCGGELLDDAVRRKTTRTLGVNIADNYGSTEGFVAWQCPRGGYHLNAEHAVVEVVDEQGAPVGPGEMGKLLITTLHNRLMPLVRYEIGDYVVASDNRCDCGRRLPLLERVVGRSINLFRLEDGRVVSPWELVVHLKYMPELVQFQIIQESVYRFTLNYVAPTDPSPAVIEQIQSLFAGVLGRRAVLTLNPVAPIPHSSSGKFCTAVSRVLP